MLTGKHLIAGEWRTSETTFLSSPAHGEANKFAAGTVKLVEEACNASEQASWSFGQTTRAKRAEFLNAIADEIESRGDAITKIGSEETGLPAARLEGERGRTTGQLRLFASHILSGEYLDRRHDAALPDRAPIPRPELHMMQRPIGPVAVFGASNFPLAFSVAGGDTAAALAAGCPVVVKGHSAHPGTGELVAQAIDAAIKSTGIHPGSFSLIQGGNREVGTALVQHPSIKAVGFTGSLGGGRALFNLCASRPEPIPFFGELGSINPMFLLPNAIRERGDEIAKAWVASLTMGAGQFCTNPGVVFLVAGAHASQFIEVTKAELEQIDVQTMLTDGIAEAFRDGAGEISEVQGVAEVFAERCERRIATPQVFQVDLETWKNNERLSEEVFGPLGVIVLVEKPSEMVEVAKGLSGQLTCTIHMTPADADEAAGLVPILEHKAGRILANGFPTGVEVSDTMVHGGPYPASTNFGATSVGTLSIRRFLRPVCYQNIPSNLLPNDLQSGPANE